MIASRFPQVLRAILCVGALSGPLPAQTIAPPPSIPPPGTGQVGDGGMRVPDAHLLTDPLWEDGLAEVSHFDLLQYRYGHVHPGGVVQVVVREALDPQRVVKAVAATGVTVPVLKVHLVKSFVTGVYRYDQAVTTFMRRSDGAVLRLLIDSHEWCGIAAKSWVNRGPGSILRVMSYFDGHGDFDQSLVLSDHAVLEDALPMWLRTWDGVTSLSDLEVIPTQLEARAQDPTPIPVTLTVRSLDVNVPAGHFPAREITVTSSAAPPAGDGVAWPPGAHWCWVGTYEAALPHRLVRWQDGAGTQWTLRSVERTDYWNHHRPEDAPKP